MHVWKASDVQEALGDVLEALGDYSLSRGASPLEMNSMTEAKTTSGMMVSR